MLRRPFEASPMNDSIDRLYKFVFGIEDEHSASGSPKPM
jgi:hypothetical protein